MKKIIAFTAAMLIASNIFANVSNSNITFAMDLIMMKQHFINPNPEYILYKGDSSKDYIKNNLGLEVVNAPDIMLDPLSYDLNGDYAVNTMDLIDEIHYLLDDKKSEFHKFDSACLDFEGKPSVDEGPNEVIFKVHGTYGEMAGGYSMKSSNNEDRITLPKLLEDSNFESAGINDVFNNHSTISFEYNGKEYLMHVCDIAASITYEGDENVSAEAIDLYWIRERIGTIFEATSQNSLMEVGGYSFVHFPDEDSFVGNYFDDETITELPSFVNDYLEENSTFEIINKELKVNIKE